MQSCPRLLESSLQYTRECVREGQLSGTNGFTIHFFKRVGVVRLQTVNRARPCLVLAGEAVAALDRDGTTRNGMAHGVFKASPAIHGVVVAFLGIGFLLNASTVVSTGGSRVLSQKESVEPFSESVDATGRQEAQVVLAGDGVVVAEALRRQNGCKHDSWFEKDLATLLVVSMIGSEWVLVFLFRYGRIVLDVAVVALGHGHGGASLEVLFGVELHGGGGGG